VLQIRRMQKEDIPLGLELCRAAGWNQTQADWERMLALSPEGAFVAEYRAQPCATAVTTSYGTRTAWIGMLMVHSDFRRRDIGSSMMRHCIEHLRAKGIESIKLDASDLGRPVYLKLGFEDERPVYRYSGARPDVSSDVSDARPLAPELWNNISECDKVAFGADRLPLLKLLNAQGIAAAVAAPSGLKGYGFARAGCHASQIGPIVAIDANTAEQIVRYLVARLPEGAVCWDFPPDNVGAKALAISCGLAVHRRFTRMFLGAQVHSGDLSLVYGTAGPELG
jgi:ribosomal protein S18 acetylase RimI-like enzyme